MVLADIAKPPLGALLLLISIIINNKYFFFLLNTGSFSKSNSFSARYNTMSALLSALFDNLIPSSSILLEDSLIPAVSLNKNLIPPIEHAEETTSLVVPCFFANNRYFIADNRVN